jgi:hypothetical protein
VNRQQQSRAKRHRNEQRQESRRSFFVLASLVSVLTLTSVLLRAMQGAPLTADAASSLVAGDSRAALSVIYNTQVPANPNRWKSIYIHHSRTSGGSAVSVASGSEQQGCGDHFVIGNGSGGALDGEIQFTARWNLQQPADPAPGYTEVEPTCVSVCVVGDFDKTAPSPMQLRRLEHLVQSLQEHFRVPRAQVWVFDQPDSPAGAGRYFPTGAFERQLLR